jgi:hypothetical protein
MPARYGRRAPTANDDRLEIEIDARRRAHWSAEQDLGEWERQCRRAKGLRSQPDEKGLEQMMVLTVDDQSVGGDFREALRGRQAAKPAPTITIRGLDC